MGKKIKETLHRSKLRDQRLMRLKAKKKEKEKIRDNNEFFKIFQQENIDKLDTKEKIEVMTQLYQILINYPESNTDKFPLMLLFLKDNSIAVISKAVEYLKNIFMESIPLYRIHEFNTNTKKESKEIKNLHLKEKNLLINYGLYLDNIKILDQSFYKKKECENLRKLFVKTLGELFEKFYYFNYEQKLYNFLCEKLSDIIPENRQEAFIHLYNVLSIVENSKTMLELKFSIIKKISNVINSKPHNRFSSNVFDLFTAHKIYLPDYKKDDEKINNIDLSDLKYAGPIASKNMNKQEYKKAQKQLKEFNKEKSKIIKSMKKDMNEIEQKEDSKMIYFMNLKILKKILLLFFEILKEEKDSDLIGGVFHNISKLCENINVEILIDLQKCVYENIKYLIKSKKLTLSLLGLKTNLDIAQKLTKDIVSVEDSYLITSSYQIISYLINDNHTIFNKDDLCIIFEVIEMIILKNRMYSLDISSAFVKKIAMLCKINKNENQIIAFLLLIKRILSKYPSLNFLIDINESDFDNFDYKNSTEPSLCNGKLTTIIPELNNIKEKFNDNKEKSKLIRKLIDYIIKEEKRNMELSSMNYYDYLLKEEK